MVGEYVCEDGERGDFSEGLCSPNYVREKFTEVRRFGEPVSKTIRRRIFLQ